MNKFTLFNTKNCLWGFLSRACVLFEGVRDDSLDCLRLFRSFPLRICIFSRVVATSLCRNPQQAFLSANILQNVSSTPLTFPSGSYIILLRTIGHICIRNTMQTATASDVTDFLIGIFTECNRLII